MGELVSRTQVDEYGMQKDNFEYVGSIVKSLTPRAIDMQIRHGELGFCIWDIAFKDGECLLQNCIAYSRFKLIQNLLLPQHCSYLSTPEMVELLSDGILVHSYDKKQSLRFDSDDPFNDMMSLAKRLGWEGYVAVDPESTYGDRALSFHGKAERPKEVCKLKPTKEADFIVRWNPEEGIGDYGKGKLTGFVGAVILYLYDPATDTEVEVSRMGGGLTQEDREKYTNKSLYPMVWKIEFKDWTKKGSIREPRLVGERDDKTTKECTIDQRPSSDTDTEEDDSDAT